MVASCGTALTVQQAQRLRGFTDKVVLSFDPDTAGQAATAKSCELLVAEGFKVMVALLEPGEDPDIFVRRRGRQAYRQRLAQAQPYLEYLLDRAASRRDLNGMRDGWHSSRSRPVRRAFPMPLCATGSPTGWRTARLVTPDIVRAEIRKAMNPKAAGRGPALVDSSGIAQLCQGDEG